MKIKMFISSVLVFGLALLLVNPFTAQAALTWTETQPAGDVNANWRAVASDADSSNLIAASGSGRLYTSDDGGATWTERQPGGDSNLQWIAVASDDDGSNLIAAVGWPGSGRLYTSSDGGANWTERQPGGDFNLSWRALASDADGSNLIAGVNGGRLYTSVDGGANWTERQPAGNFDRGWNSAASDADGSNLIAGYGGTGRLYTSSDGGANWTERQPAGAVTRNWYSVASDNEGTHLVAAVGGGRLYTSSNGGSSWIERTPLGFGIDTTWSVASDDDGSHILVGASGQDFYTSSDGGANWTDEDLSPAAFTTVAGASDADGSNLIVAVTGGRVYLGSDTTGPAISTLSPADDATDVATNANLIITFDETVVASSTGSVVIYDASDDSVVATIPADDAQVTVNDDEVTVNPTADLTEGTDYYVQIDDGAFEDESGNPFAGIDDETTWSFTTIPPDETAPTISSLDPEDNATGIAVNYLANSGATIEFDETVVAGTGSVTIYDASDDSVVAVYDVENEDYVYIEDNVAYIYTEQEEVLLERETAYYILIDEGAFEDEVGNPFAGIDDETTWNFTTAGVPTVIIDDEFVTGTGFNSTVFDLVLQDDGKIVVGGGYGGYNGDFANYIARLNADGSLDETFVTGDGFDADVSKVTLDADGKILVGGYFTSYDGATSAYIARLNTDGSLDETFVTGEGFNGNVVDIAVQDDGKIVVVGWFDGYDGNTVGYGIVRLNTDGSLDETFVTGDGFNDSPLSVYIQDDGKIIVGGYFDGYDGDLFGFGIVRLNTDGSLDETFVTGDGFDDGVGVITMQEDGKILVGGFFASYDGVSIGSGIARLNTDGSLDDTLIAGDGFDGYAETILIQDDGKIVLGGNFTEYDGVAAVYIVRINSDGSIDGTFTTGDGFNSNVYALAIQDDGKIVVGGTFQEYDGVSIGSGIARLIPPEDEAEPEPEEEEEESPSRGGGSSSHRRSSGGGSSTPAVSGGAPAGSVEALMEQLVILLTQLLEQLLAEQGQ